MGKAVEGFMQGEGERGGLCLELGDSAEAQARCRAHWYRGRTVSPSLGNSRPNHAPRLLLL